MELQVPEDVSVVGYDDIEVASYVGLTTINQSLHRMGDEGVHTLLQIFSDDSDLVLSHTLSVSLVVRHTTAPVSGSL